MPDSGKKHLLALFDYTIEKGIKFIQRHTRFQPIVAPELSTIMTLCNILTAYFDFMLQNGGFGNPGKLTILILFGKYKIFLNYFTII